MESKKEKQKGKEKEKVQQEEDFLKIECRMYEEKYPKENDLVMVMNNIIFMLVPYCQSRR